MNKFLTLIFSFTTPILCRNPILSDKCFFFDYRHVRVFFGVWRKARVASEYPTKKSTVKDDLLLCFCYFQAWSEKSLRIYFFTFSSFPAISSHL